jgi:hypothetical protein
MSVVIAKMGQDGRERETIRAAKPESVMGTIQAAPKSPAVEQAAKVMALVMFLLYT